MHAVHVQQNFEVGTPTTTTGLAAAGEPSTAANSRSSFKIREWIREGSDQQLTAITS